MTIADPAATAVTVYFEVRIDGHDLGAFTACDGLGLEVAIEKREEGGVNTFVHQLAGRISYSNVKLTRPLNGDSGKVASWFASMGGTVRRTQAEIVAKTHDAEPVARWSLTGVVPVRWQGPSLSVEGPKIATETLELAHHGFLEHGGGG
jgi:phage tail-like protein